MGLSGERGQLPMAIVVCMCPRHESCYDWIVMKINVN